MFVTKTRKPRSAGGASAILGRGRGRGRSGRSRGTSDGNRGFAGFGGASATRGRGMVPMAGFYTTYSVIWFLFIIFIARIFLLLDFFIK
jgi:hypothetical protein